MRSDGDVPELKGRAEIYSIMCPTGVCLWLSVNPGDLQPDLDLLSLHTTSGSAPEGINSSGFKKKKKKNHCQDVHEGMLAGWKLTLKLILLFLAFSAQLLIHKPSLNRPVWQLVIDSLHPQLAGRAADTLGAFSFLCGCDFTPPVSILVSFSA